MPAPFQISRCLKFRHPFAVFSLEMWTALFIVQAVVDILPVTVNFIKPNWNFPGVNATGILASCWWNASTSCAVGWSCLIVVALNLADNDIAKSVVGLCVLEYNLSINLMTVIFLKRGKQVDGTDASCPGCLSYFTSTPQRANFTKGALGIVIHSSMWISFGVFLLLNSPSQYAFRMMIIAIVFTLYVLIFSTVSATRPIASSPTSTLAIV